MKMSACVLETKTCGISAIFASNNVCFLFLFKILSKTLYDTASSKGQRKTKYSSSKGITEIGKVTLSLVSSRSRGLRPVVKRSTIIHEGFTRQARIQKFFKGGIEEENFERKMFVDTRINACTHKN